MTTLDILGFLHLGFADIIDIIVVALILFVAFRWLRGSSAVNIFIAILMLFVIRIVAVALNMKLLSALLDAINNGDISTGALRSATGNLLAIPGLNTRGQALAGQINNRVDEILKEYVIR